MPKLRLTNETIEITDRQAEAIDKAWDKLPAQFKVGDRTINKADIVGRVIWEGVAPGAEAKQVGLHDLFKERGYDMSWYDKSQSEQRKLR